MAKRGASSQETSQAIAVLIVLVVLGVILVPPLLRDRANQEATKAPTPVPTAAQEPTSILTPNPGEYMALEPKTYYVEAGGANVRTCARRDCALMVDLPTGAPVTVTGAINGDNVEPGNVIWYVIDMGGDKVGYVYSGLVSLVAPVSVQSVQPTRNPVSPFGCNGQDDLNCSHFDTIGQNANAHLAQCGDEDKLDADGDGQACEQAP